MRKIRKYKFMGNIYSKNEICGRLAHIGFNISLEALDKQIRRIDYKYNKYQKDGVTIFEEGLVEEALLNFCVERWGEWYGRQKEMAKKILGDDALKDIEKKHEKYHEEWVLKRRKNLRNTKNIGHANDTEAR